MLKTCIKTIAATLVSLTVFSSCDRGVLLNSEADILEVVLPDGMKVGAPIISNTKVRIPKMASTPEESEMLEAQLQTLAPQFILTPGAVITDAGVEKDFSFPQKYTVTSEDRQWTKEYEVSFFDIFNKTEFSFERFEENSQAKPYHIFYEVDDRQGKQYVWSSGNAGFAMTAGSKPAEEYPTAMTPRGHIDRGARLTTRSTGAFGAVVKMPIAAGNLFLGTFDVTNATAKPLEATQFGVPTVMNNPKELTLWAKYQAGPEYKDREGNVLDITDRPEVYAVLYEPETDAAGRPIKLNGTDIRTADNIISMAVMSEEQAEQIRVSDIENAPYKQITIPFVPNTQKEFNPDKQRQGIYHIALVFSSSANGQLFEGAVGSILCVDEVKFAN